MGHDQVRDTTKNGSGREQLPTVRANPLKFCGGTAADGEDAKLLS